MQCTDNLCVPAQIIFASRWRSMRTARRVRRWWASAPRTAPTRPRWRRARTPRASSTCGPPAASPAGLPQRRALCTVQREHQGRLGADDSAARPRPGGFTVQAQAFRSFCPVEVEALGAACARKRLSIREAKGFSTPALRGALCVFRNEPGRAAGRQNVLCYLPDYRQDGCYSTHSRC